MEGFSAIKYIQGIINCSVCDLPDIDVLDGCSIDENFWKYEIGFHINSTAQCSTMNCVCPLVYRGFSNTLSPWMYSWWNLFKADIMSLVEAVNCGYVEFEVNSQ